MRFVLALVALVLLPLTALAQKAEGQRASAADKATIAACLKLANENGEKSALAKDTPDDKPGAAGRLQAAAAQALMNPESCIGAISGRCIQAPGGSTTSGMIECLDRELMVWDERLNAAYREALKGVSPKLAATIRATQRAWVQWRDASCKVPVLENEGGSIVGPLVTECLLDATARQSIWLEARSK